MIVSETVKRSLLEIFGSGEYLFEDSRGLTGRGRVKVSEPEPLGRDSGLLKFSQSFHFHIFLNHQKWALGETHRGPGGKELISYWSLA
jgi:hypothetical protein